MEKKNNDLLYEFARKITKAMQDYYGEGVEVMLHQVAKNNDLERWGITVKCKKTNVSPTIYLDTFYDEYTQGETFANIVKSIINIYETNKFEEDIDIEFMREYKNIKATIVFKLINLDKNKRRLENMPYIEFLDLALTCQCMMHNERFGMGAIMVHNNLLKLWNISKEELFYDARKNTEKLYKPDIKAMNDILFEWMDENINCAIEQQLSFSKEEGEFMIEHVISDMTSELDDNQIQMYVLTNRQKINGATTIIYDGLLHKIGTAFRKSYYVIPSSIHEVIIIPDNGCLETNELTDMIRDVNETQLQIEEVLVDHPYYYDYSCNELKII